jgi:hypothetical protein
VKPTRGVLDLPAAPLARIAGSSEDKEGIIAERTGSPQTHLPAARRAAAVEPAWPDDAGRTPWIFNAAGRKISPLEMVSDAAKWGVMRR